MPVLECPRCDLEFSYLGRRTSPKCERCEYNVPVGGRPHGRDLATDDEDQAEDGETPSDGGTTQTQLITDGGRNRPQVSRDRADTKWPEQRTEAEQEYVDSMGLEDLPENLHPDHQSVHRWTFIGVPNSTLVYSVAFTPGCSFIERANWLINAQREGWEIAGVSTYRIYDGSLRVYLGRFLPGALGRVFADETISVRLQYVGDHDGEGVPEYL